MYKIVRLEIRFNANLSIIFYFLHMQLFTNRTKNCSNIGLWYHHFKKSGNVRYGIVLINWLKKLVNYKLSTAERSAGYALHEFNPHGHQTQQHRLFSNISKIHLFGFRTFQIYKLVNWLKNFDSFCWDSCLLLWVNEESLYNWETCFCWYLF